MNKIEISRVSLRKSGGEAMTLVYSVTVDELVDAVSGEVFSNYGVMVSVPESGETASVRGVTLSGDRIFSLASKLARHRVTPITLRDVLDDWLISQEDIKGPGEKKAI